ncbi:hypothetical protein QQ045_004559 [Rhodiola kirilowii]
MPDMSAPYKKGVRDNERNITNEHIFQVNVLYGVIDLQLAELEDRFLDTSMELLTLSASFHPRNGFQAFKAGDVCILASKFYPYDFTSCDMDNLEMECGFFVGSIEQDSMFAKMTSISDLCRLLIESGKSIYYPMIYRLICLILTLPGSMSTTERAFSSMKIIKNDIRIKMSDEFLDDLMPSPSPLVSLATATQGPSIKLGEKCDLFSGKWVRNTRAPYYTNVTCWAIHEYQNCTKYGRQDTDYLKWQWQPDRMGVICPSSTLLVSWRCLEISQWHLLETVARNYMQSLMCLLSRVEDPVDESYTPDEQFKRWIYKTYNFTLATFWTPHLVRAKYLESTNPTLPKIHHLYLDEHDEKWTSQIEDFSYVRISGGHWFFSPMVYHEEGRIVGCHYCQDKKVLDLKMYYGYKKAMRTALKAINDLKHYKGVTFLRTFAPSHFENGAWNQGGDCVRKRPYRSNETSLVASNLEVYLTQVEEFKVAEREGIRRGLKFRLLDVTPLMLLRPDGHPSKYGHWPNGTQIMSHNDCVHWCLPGPIDNWNDLLLEMLKMDGRKEN